MPLKSIIALVRRFGPALVIALAMPGIAGAAEPIAAEPTAAEVREQLRGLNQALGRIVSPDGVDDQRLVSIGGVEQWVAVRGQDRRAPILLFLHGGPADPISPEAYMYQRPWEDFFTVVNWDQRGAGRSKGALADNSGRTGIYFKEQLISDAIELIDKLRTTYHQPKIILVGQSWGTVLALEIAHRRPDLLYAVVTQGLATNWLGRVEVNRQALIAAADKRGDAVSAKALRNLGPMPAGNDWDGVAKWLPGFGQALGPEGQQLLAEHFWWNVRGPGDSAGKRLDLLKSVSPDYSAKDYEDAKASALKLTAADMAARFHDTMAPALAWDAEQAVGTRFAVPVIVMMGSEDWTTPFEMAKDYYAKLCAPYKKFIAFPNAAHVLNAERPGLSVVSLVTEVLPAVHGQVPADAETCKDARPSR